jgi:hypothetical protein
VSTATLRAYCEAHRSQFSQTAQSSLGQAGPVAVAADDGFAQAEPQVEQICEDSAYSSWVSAAAQRAKITTKPSVLNRVPIS